ncbi:Prolyl 4-hydroxylase subunit alpha [Oopsacas minuta]|uniref:Prolyl 4-hydroxylase subunit alpha n=1 Tax=Oopsacas minuta TaxID=111878 RepID=A0AAV7K556_9METZ|nr:Prolyl 4-hydroxylase subunit alpha [Oopsacas minuta]
MQFIWLSLFCFVCVSIVAHGGNDLFTSVMDLRELYGHEQEMKSVLKKYLDSEENKLKKIREFYESLPNSDNTAIEYIKGPINSFAILKRAKRDWDSKLSDLVYEDNTHDLMAFVAEKRHKFPNEGDLKGGLIGLKRLLDTYKLPMPEITNGSLSLDNRPISADECFEIGTEAYKQELWEMAVIWLEEALRLKEEGHERLHKESQVTMFEVLDYLVYSQYKMGNTYGAYITTLKLLKIVPDWAQSRIEGNLAYFRGILTPEELEGNRVEDVKEEFSPMGTSLFWGSDDVNTYETLCREPQKLPPERERKLKCFYYSNSKTLNLLYNPAKIEMLHDTPRIYSLRQVLSEVQMTRIEELGKQKLYRATARNHLSGKFEPADYRIAKSSWLSNNDDMEIFPIVNQRLEDITGLEMDTAEDLQLGVYGIGGHYEPHYDHARNKKDAYGGGFGNRIATILFYVSL